MRRSHIASLPLRVGGTNPAADWTIDEPTLFCCLIFLFSLFFCCLMRASFVEAICKLFCSSFFGGYSFGISTVKTTTTKNESFLLGYSNRSCLIRGLPDLFLLQSRTWHNRLICIKTDAANVVKPKKQIVTLLLILLFLLLLLNKIVLL